MVSGRFRSGIGTIKVVKINIPSNCTARFMEVHALMFSCTASAGSQMIHVPYLPSFSTMASYCPLLRLCYPAVRGH